jgi:hypothetical protein
MDCVGQVLDYHIALRVDDGLKCFGLLFKLTRVIVCLDGNQRGYQKSMMMQLLLLMYQKSRNLPTWKMFLGSVSVYNEEAGETSFSILSRVVLGDCLKSDFEHMDKQYKLTRQYALVTEEIKTEQSRTNRKHGFVTLTAKGVEIVTVAAFMLEKIRAITLNSFTCYTGAPKAKNPAYDMNANLTKAYTDENRFWIPDIVPLCLRTMVKYRQACTGTWAFDSGLHRIWPKFHNPLRVAVITGDHAAVMAGRDRLARIASGSADHEDVEQESTEEDDDSEYEEPVVRVPGKAIQDKRSVSSSVVLPDAADARPPKRAAIAKPVRGANKRPPAKRARPRSSM